jgi:DNA-binding NarL/FixJ family response regulator
MMSAKTARINGETRSPWPEKDGALRDLVARGLTTQKICAELGVSYYLVVRRCKQLMLKRLSMSAASKQAWADPAVRAKMSAAQKQAWADPAVRAKMSAARKQAWADPAMRAKMSAASKQAWADPAVRAKISAASKQAWADPAKGPKHLRGLSPSQREIYALYKKKGFSQQEAIDAALSHRQAA